jgi:lipopolysaccharide transport system ATP-binding protein
MKPAGRDKRFKRVSRPAAVRPSTFHADVERPTVGLLIRDRLGNDVFGTNTYYLDVVETARRSGAKRLTASFATRLNLGPAAIPSRWPYTATRDHYEHNFDWWDRALVFEVVSSNAFRFQGAALLPIEARLEKQTR